MPGTSKFVPNPLGILEAFRQPMMLEAMGAIAGVIAERARGLAPVDEDDEEQGHYRDRIVPKAEIWPPGTGIAKGAVLATKYNSGWIEFGTIKTPRFAVLRRAAEEFGPVVGGKGGEVE